jgi:hydroxyacylglutathione hydrolase
MKIQIIPCLQDNYSYLIIDEENNTACVIDPSEADPIIEYIENNKIKLKFILNTHHHYDHVGGNKKLKEKYGASVVGYVGDKQRIPGIDILLDDQETWIRENFEAKIIYIPGHTLGHICFYFKKLPKDTKVYCGHEYTKKNSDFCLTHDINNNNLKTKIHRIDEKLKRGLPTVPSTIKDELECNIFLRSNNVETFSKLRYLKDNF